MNIFNRNNELSNNYILEMEIDGKKWKNVSQYVYSNLVRENSHKTILKNNLKKMSKQFQELIGLEEERLIANALSMALPVKFSDIELSRKLLSTGDEKIIYKSLNLNLGVSDGKGKNIYGNLLMEIRKGLRTKNELKYKTDVDTNLKKSIVKAYLVQYFLTDYMYRGYNINRFSNMSLNEIYNIALNEDQVPRDVVNSFFLYKKSIDKLPLDEVIGFVPPEIREYPLRVYDFVLKSRLRNFQIFQQEKRKTIIYEKYVEYFLSKKGLNNERVKDLFELFPKMVQNKEKIKNHLEIVYNNNEFPYKLQTEIYNILKNMVVISDKQVQQAESVSFDIKGTRAESKRVDTKIENQQRKSEKTTSLDNFLDFVFDRQGGESKLQDTTKPKTTQKEDIRAILDAVIEGREIQSFLLQKYDENPSKYIVIDPSKNNELYYDLTPVAFTQMLNIQLTEQNKDKKLFPTVSHYLLFRFINNVINNIDESYRMLYLDYENFAQLDMINDRYRSVLFEKYSFYLRKALNVKIRNEFVAQALADTENQVLYYNDPDDEILGTGPFRTGGNLTGTILMELRSRLNIPISQKVINKKTDLTVVEKFIENQVDWIENRVKDYCNSILNIGLQNKPEEIIKILDKLYPCQFMLSFIKIPDYFVKIVKSEIPSINIRLVNYIWSKLSSLCDYIIKNSRNPEKMLESASLIVQNKAFSKTENKNKAIKLAILNIADKIKDENQTVNKKHLDLATNIILLRNNDIENVLDVDFASDDEKSESEKSIDYGDSQSGEEYGEEDEGEDLYGDSPKREEGRGESDEESGEEESQDNIDEHLNKKVNEVLNYDISENIKQGRINFFQLI